MALGWLAIGIIILVLFIAVFKSQDLIYLVSLVKKNFFIVLFILLILFLTFSFIGVYRANDIDLTNYEGFVQAGKIYFTWFVSLFSNVGNVIGYAVNQDWVNQNSTNITR